jgi:hypothetical protein
MPGVSAAGCRILGCRQPVPSAISSCMLCTGHFLERASSRANAVWEAWQRGIGLDVENLDALLHETQSAAHALISADLHPEVNQQEEILEFLLCVANLHEFAAQYPS